MTGLGFFLNHGQKFREDYPASMIAMVYRKVGHLIIP